MTQEDMDKITGNLLGPPRPPRVIEVRSHELSEQTQAAITRGLRMGKAAAGSDPTPVLGDPRQRIGVTRKLLQILGVRWLCRKLWHALGLALNWMNDGKVD